MPLSDDELRQLRRRATFATAAANRMLRSGLFELAQRNATTLQRYAAWVDRNQSLLRQVPEYIEAARQLSLRYQRAFRIALPPNWADLTSPDVFRVIDVMKETGFSLVWAPRTDVVRALIEAPPAGRDAVLLSFRADVLDDLDEVVKDIKSPRLRDIPAGLKAALYALREGHDEAAQALATVLFTALIQGPLRYKGHGEARDHLADEDRDAALSHLRLRAIGLAAGKALGDFNPLTLRPRHGRYNRHASAHSYLREQYSELCALVAVLLVVSLTRECDFWLTTHGDLPADA